MQLTSAYSRFLARADDQFYAEPDMRKKVNDGFGDEDVVSTLFVLKTWKLITQRKFIY